MVADHEELITLLENIYNKGNKEWNRPKYKVEQHTESLSVASNNITIITNNRHLASYLKGSFGENPERDVNPRVRILLPPITDHLNFVPLLSIYRNPVHDSAVQGYSFRLEMFNVEEKQFFGLRFDWGSPGSDHAYFHVQINDKVHGYEDTQNLNWLPRKKPVIPLFAVNPKSFASLLLILYGCIYGFDLKEDILTGIKFARSELRLYPPNEQSFSFSV